MLPQFWKHCQLLLFCLIAYNNFYYWTSEVVDSFIVAKVKAATASIGSGAEIPVHDNQMAIDTPRALLPPFYYPY